MALAIFDLDNTLIGGDSDHLWGCFLCEQGLVDSADFAATNEQFFLDYQAGELDIDAYLRFALAPLAGRSRADLARWHRQFMASKIAPIMLPKARTLIASHRAKGDELLIITATNGFITQPIAAALGIDQLIASEGEIIDGRYTGEPSGTPSYKEGKIARLQQWLTGRNTHLEGAYFYSDSHNDIPLLEVVDHAIAVDPDPQLRAQAQQRGWPIISLRD